MKPRAIKKGGIKPARRPAATVLKVDRDWFEDQLRKNDISARQFCLRYLGAVRIDPSMWTRIIQGGRGLAPMEVEAIAAGLHVPVGEVLRRIGVNPDVGSTDNVPVVGWVDVQGEIHKGPGAAGARRVPAPISLGSRAKAVRYKTKGTAADECIAFYDERGDVDTGAVGRLAVVQLTDGRRFIGVLARAPRG